MSEPLLAGVTTPRNRTLSLLTGATAASVEHWCNRPTTSRLAGDPGPSPVSSLSASTDKTGPVTCTNGTLARMKVGLRIPLGGGIRTAGHLPAGGRDDA